MPGRRRRSRSGQTATEYALVLAFVSIGMIAALYSMMPRIRAGMGILARNVQWWLCGP